MKRTLLFVIAMMVLAGAGATKMTDTEKQYLDFLYAIMNPADIANRSKEFYLENSIRPALKAREELPWGKKISERDFRHFVLPLRVNNEAIDRHRPIF